SYHLVVCRISLRSFGVWFDRALGYVRYRLAPSALRNSYSLGEIVEVRMVEKNRTTISYFESPFFEVKPQIAARKKLHHEEEISGQLLHYLRECVQGASLNYSEGPTRITGGFETSVFSMTLSGVPESLSGSLILRLFAEFEPPERARLEATVH